jgi:hypothetical protein
MMTFDRRTKARPSRRERRALERRQDRLLARLFGLPIPRGFDPSSGAVIVDEGGTVAFFAAHALPFALFAIGLDAKPEADWWRAGSVSVLVNVDGWMSLGFVKFATMSKGGQS